MDVICEACGTANKSSAEFCSNCGRYLRWDGPAAVPEPESRPRSQLTPMDPDELLGDRSGRPVPTDQQVLTIEAPEKSESAVCSTCWRVNEPGLRFCAKCGTRISWTQAEPLHIGSAELRRHTLANQRAFRDSLPAIYRLRRIGLVVLAIAVVGALAITVGANPVGWVKARWYDIRGTVVVVPGVQATVLPPTGGRPQKAGSTVSPGLLVDGTSAEWHVQWTADEAATSCDGGTTSTTGAVTTEVPTIELTMAQPIRIRDIGIFGGLAADQPERAQQFRPRTIGITAVGAGGCKLVSLPDSADLQRLKFDTKRPVSVIRISLDSAYPGPAGAQQLSIREIELFSRPQ